MLHLGHFVGGSVDKKNPAPGANTFFNLFTYPLGLTVALSTTSSPSNLTQLAIDELLDYVGRMRAIGIQSRKVWLLSGGHDGSGDW